MEGIFRINPEITLEESIRDQLKRGIVPANVDCHCLAGLIKVPTRVWFFACSIEFNGEWLLSVRCLPTSATFHVNDSFSVLELSTRW